MDRTQPPYPGHPGWRCCYCGDWTAKNYRCTGTCEKDLTDAGKLELATNQTGMVEVLG